MKEFKIDQIKLCDYLKKKISKIDFLKLILKDMSTKYLLDLMNT